VLAIFELSEEFNDEKSLEAVIDSPDVQEKLALAANDAVLIFGKEVDSQTVIMERFLTSKNLRGEKKKRSRKSGKKKEEGHQKEESTSQE